MARKTFVSLYFSAANKLQVIQLNSHKSKVERFLTIDLPKKLLNNYKVEETQTLAKILRSVWKKLKLKERTVGIVVPEFSTFIKVLNIPKLESKELNEAIHWQAQEYLPKGLTDMVLDWKFVKETEKEYQVLVIAMEKEILTSYVNAAAGAGLFPLVVETPSLSLARVAGSDDTGTLSIYKSFDEMILVVSQGEKIFGSTVVPMDDYSKVIDVVTKMIGHYKDAQVGKIKIGGIEFDTRLADELAKITKMKIEWQDISITGIEKEKIQEYLIPIALQMEDPLEPADVHTINLLPDELVSKYSGEKVRLQVWSLTLLASLFIWISFVAALGVFLYLGREIEANKQSSTPQGSSVNERTATLNEVKRINKLTDDVLKVTSILVPPEKILNGIYTLKPADISINEYKIGFDKGDIKLAGISQSRSSLIEFKQRLEDSPNFSNIIIPISSFEVETNLNFEMSFFYDPLVEDQKKTEVKSGTQGM